MTIPGGLDALTRAQGLLETSARRIAQGGPPTPETMIDLLRAKQQFSAGTKVIRVEDEMTRKLLHVHG